MDSYSIYKRCFKFVKFKQILIYRTGIIQLEFDFVMNKVHFHYHKK